MTRNTKYYKTKAFIDGKETDIYYRDLTSAELSVVSNIKNILISNEFAANIAISNIPIDKVAWEDKVKIGEDIKYRSSQLISDMMMLGLYIDEVREKIKNGDQFLMWSSHILRKLPGISIIDLMNLTYKDLVELVVLAEQVSGEKIFGAQKKGMSLVNPADLPDGGKALRDQIAGLNTQVGIRR